MCWQIFGSFLLSFSLSFLSWAVITDNQSQKRALVIGVLATGPAYGFTPHQLRVHVSMCVHVYLVCSGRMKKTKQTQQIPSLSSSLLCSFIPASFNSNAHSVFCFPLKSNTKQQKRWCLFTRVLLLYSANLNKLIIACLCACGFPIKITLLLLFHCLIQYEYMCILSVGIKWKTRDVV